MNYAHFDTVDGARLAFRDEGEGVPVLALAGLTRDGRDFDYFLQHHPRCRLIRLDSRGRGGSSWTGAATYTVAQETKDAVALLDHLGIPKVGILGTSRGGLIGLVMAATARDRLAGICFNDVGPVLEIEGLRRIAEYVGVKPSVATLEEVADRLPSRSPGFANVSDFRWAEEAVRHFTETPDGIGLTYDPELRTALNAALSQPLADVWPLFEACAGLSLALIRGANSDVLSAKTAAEMCRRRPDMLHAEIPDRGHAPFLDEPAALDVLFRWIGMLPHAEQTAKVATA